MALRNGNDPDPEYPSMNRHVEGQKMYFRTAKAWNRESFVVDNSNFLLPLIIESNQVSAIHL